MKHTHKAIKGMEKERCFNGPVAFPEKLEAHGNIARTDFCRCGAKRVTNINGKWKEYGPWDSGM